MDSGRRASLFLNPGTTRELEVNFTQTRFIPGGKKTHSRSGRSWGRENPLSPAESRNMIFLTSNKQPRHSNDYVVPTAFLGSSLIIQLHEIFSS
jgi:hypothetical protein